MGHTTHNKPKQESNSIQEVKQISKKDTMLSLVEILYRSNTINEATYIKVKRAIKQEVKQ